MANDSLKVVIGKRQIVRELKNDNIAEIKIAANAEQAYIHSLIEIAKQNEVKYSICGSMEEFASHFWYRRSVGAIGILKESLAKFSLSTSRRKLLV